MKKFIDNAIMLAFFFGVFLISNDVSSVQRGKIGKDFLHSKKVVHRIEKQNKRNLFNIKKEKSFQHNKYISKNDPIEFNWTMVLLLSMLLIDDVHGKYFVNTHVDNSSIAVENNSSREIIPINNIENETNTSFYAVDRTSFISINDVLDFYRMNLLTPEKQVVKVNKLKNKLSFKNNECNIESLSNNLNYAQKKVFKKEKETKKNVFIPNYKKITGAEFAHKNLYMGRNAIVFMIDTCVDKRSLLSESNVAFSYEPNDLYENNKFMYENHGTHVSGIIQTMAPHATLISINLNEKDYIDFNIIHQNIEHFRTMDQKIDAVNYSVKLNSIDDERLINEVKMLTDNDIVIFMALGNDWNDGSDVQYYKDLINFVNRAEFNGLVRVVANLEYFGNEGSETFHVSSNRCSDGLDCKYLIVAPGTNICSTLPNKEVGLRTGTSMATPVVVGAYALLRGAFPNKKAIAILDLIDESARKVDLDGKALGDEYGVGVIDIESAINLATEKGWTVKKGWFKKLIEFLFF